MSYHVREAGSRAITCPFDTQVAFTRAIDYLGAVEVAPASRCEHLFACANPHDCGFIHRFAYYSRIRNREGWQVCGRTALLSLAGTKEREGGEWEAISAKRMPSWWTPQHQFCQWSNAVGVVVVGTREYCEQHAVPGTYDRFVTVDLDTGKEIPA